MLAESITCRNETRGEAYERKGYIYSVQMVHLAMDGILALKQHIVLEENQSLDVLSSRINILRKSRSQGEFTSIILLSFWDSREALEQSADPRLQSDASHGEREYVLAFKSTASVCELVAH